MKSLLLEVSNRLRYTRPSSNCQSQEDREVTVLLISFQCCAREPHLEDLRSFREFLRSASVESETKLHRDH